MAIQVVRFQMKDAGAGAAAIWSMLFDPRIASLSQALATTGTPAACAAKASGKVPMLIAKNDGHLDLGVQRNRVVSA